MLWETSARCSEQQHWLRQRLPLPLGSLVLPNERPAPALGLGLGTAAPATPCPRSQKPGVPGSGAGGPSWVSRPFPPTPGNLSGDLGQSAAVALIPFARRSCQGDFGLSFSGKGRDWQPWRWGWFAPVRGSASAALAEREPGKGQKRRKCSEGDS